MSTNHAYAELAVTTNFSFLRGASHPQEMVAAADALGLAAIGIADRNSFAGVVRAYAEAKKRKSIKLLVGTRLVTSDGFEVLAYPTDREATWAALPASDDGQSRREEGRVPTELRSDSRHERRPDAHRSATPDELDFEPPPHSPLPGLDLGIAGSFAKLPPPQPSPFQGEGTGIALEIQVGGDAPTMGATRPSSP